MRRSAFSCVFVAMAAGLAAAPAAADPFCATLAKIVATVPSDFKTIRGKPDSAYSQLGDETSFTTRVLSLPGSMTNPKGMRCSVKQADNNAQTGAAGHYFYVCNFAGTGDPQTDVANLARRIAACLVQPAPTVDSSGSLPQAELTVANVSYRIDAEQEPDHIDASLYPYNNSPIAGWRGVSLTIMAPYN